jgi:hypothetical protein
VGVLGKTDHVLRSGDKKIGGEHGKRREFSMWKKGEVSTQVGIVPERFQMNPVSWVQVS